jgi:hypothetical protein
MACASSFDLFFLAASGQLAALPRRFRENVARFEAEVDDVRLAGP